MPRTVLITGAAGFIGSSVSEKLLKLGYKVVGIDNFNDYYNPAWKKENVARLQKFKNFFLITSDILNEEELGETFAEYQIDAVIHAAARAGVRSSIADPKLYEAVNIRGTLNLLELVRKHKVSKFVFASSSSVYGNQSKVPFSENDRVDNPISPYAATKKAGEELCYTYSHLYGISVSCLRFFTVYGPYGRPDMAPYLFTEAILKGRPIKRFGKGDSGRDYTYIDDIVSGVIAATDYSAAYSIFNLGNSHPVMLNDFITMLETIIGRKAKIQELPKQQGDVDITYADIDKASSLLAYEPQIDLKLGLSKFVAWYRKYRFDNVADE